MTGPTLLSGPGSTPFFIRKRVPGGCWTGWRMKSAAMTQGDRINRCTLCPSVRVLLRGMQTAGGTMPTLLPPAQKPGQLFKDEKTCQ
ncbi:hypothetical protein EGJ53_11970 [Pseudomonas fluorescens]|nr:hypothetical protein EGJ53_11970 [Pseudomonas fluorescens]